MGGKLMAIMEMNVTTCYCKRNSSNYTDMARFGTASGGHYKYSELTFGPDGYKSEELALLRNSKITKVSVKAFFEKKGGNYTKVLPFGWDANISFWPAYNGWEEKIIWEGDTSRDASGWGVSFLNHFKSDTSLKISIAVNSDTVPSGKDYASNYGAIGYGNAEEKTRLIIEYQPLSSELNISNNKEFTIGQSFTVPLNRYSSDYEESIRLEYLNDKNETEALNLRNNSGNSTQFNFSLPLSIANNIANEKSREGKIIVTTSNEKKEQIGEIKEYPILLVIPLEIFFVKESFKITSVSENLSLIKEKYFIQNFTKAKFSFSFSNFIQGDFTDNASLKTYRITNSSLNFDSGTKSFSSEETSATYTTSEVFSVSGEYTFNIEIKDSRGNSKTFSFDPINIQAYAKPEIINISLNRINELGAEDDEGQYCQWTGTLKYSSVQYDENKKNFPIELLLSYGSGKSKTIGFTKEENFNSYIAQIIDTENPFNSDTSYLISARIKDMLCSDSDARTETLSSTKYLIHFGQKGKGLGLGSSALYKNKITCGWDMHFNHENGYLKVEEGGTGVGSYDGLAIELSDYFLSKNGGKIQGTLDISNSAIWNTINFTPTLKNKTMGQICYQTGTTGTTDKYNVSRFYFRQNSYDATNYDTNGKYEYYRLPDTPADLSENKTYDIAVFGKNIIYSNTEPTVINGAIWLKPID